MEEKIDAAIKVVKRMIPAMRLHSDWQKAGQAILNLEMSKAQYAALTRPSDELNEEVEFMLGRVRSNLGATELQQVTQAVQLLASAKAQHEALNQAAQPAKAPAKTTKTKTD